MATAKKTKPVDSVKAYLAALPPERRRDVEAVRRLVRDALPAGYQEGVLYSMISWFVPPERCARTYNGQPLAIAALAAQKQYNALYLMGVYGDPALRKTLEDAYRKAGQRLDFGKSCLRFRSADELPRAALEKVLAKVSVDDLVEQHDAVHGAKRLKAVSLVR